MRLPLSLILLIATTAWGADAGKGAVVLERQGCLTCHTIREEGAGHEALQPAPDLASGLAKRYSPAALAATLWNHTPEMWSRFAASGTPPPAATEDDWADLFAYLYSLQNFDLPGQVRRGEQVLKDKKCSECHALPGSTPATALPGPPVEHWPAADPVQLVFNMWNHAPTMRDRIAANREQWKTLSGRDLLDITTYVQRIQNTLPDRKFELPPALAGQPLFEKNCATCHNGPMSLATRLRNATWADISAGMWNHAPQMLDVPFVTVEDMRAILAYVWELQYTGQPGSRLQGQYVFERKGCITCHVGDDGHAVSPRPGKTFSPYSMVALGWGDGRAMHHSMIGQGVSWPELSAADVANLVAYMSALPPN